MRRIWLLLALSCNATRAPGTTAAALSDPALIHVETGDLAGAIEGPIRAFRGIPYAAPPLGDLRWRTPRPPLPWSGVRDATQFGPWCPQLSFNGGDFVGDEDCLTLNVFTPAALPAHPMPVLVWIHGGGSRLGSAAEPVFDAPGLALQNVVVVTVSYRLGGLGRLAIPAFGRDLGHIGNWSQEDQLAALRWVQRNIAAFGGEPDRVLLFGESSGAGDVGNILASPEAVDLFHAAALESGLGRAFTVDQGYAISEAASAALGCAGAADEPACLRALPAETVVRATFVKGTFPPPLIDGTFLTAEPVGFVENNGTVPLLIGNNRDEGTSLVGDTTQPLTQDEFLANVTADVGPDAAAALVPVYAAYATPQLGYIAYETDIVFTCPNRSFARKVAASGPVYPYLFAHALENDPDGPRLLAYHGSELYFVFGTLVQANADGDYVPSAAEQHLSDLMGGAWAEMARHDHPHGAGLPQWPRTRADNPKLLVWDDVPSVVTGYHDQACDVMESFGLL